MLLIYIIDSAFTFSEANFFFFLGLLTFKKCIYFIYFWLPCIPCFVWVLSSWSVQASRCGGFSRFRAQSRCMGFVVAGGLSCSAACGISPDQGSDLFPLHWQADSYALDPQGSQARPTAVMYFFPCLNIFSPKQVNRLSLTLGRTDKLGLSKFKGVTSLKEGNNQFHKCKI